MNKSKIAAIMRLRDHPETSATERQAAQDALDRLGYKPNASVPRQRNKPFTIRPKRGAKPAAQPNPPPSMDCNGYEVDPDIPIGKQVL